VSKQVSTEYRPLGQEFRNNRVDEISLVDIAIILYRRKGIVIGTFILCVVAALGLGVLMGKTYEYSTAVTIGVLDDGSPIESQQALESRLLKAYIPMVLGKIAAAHGEEIENLRYKVNVALPKQGNFVLISSKVKESDAEEIKGILTELVALVIAAHTKEQDAKRALLSQQIGELEREKAAYLSSISQGVNADPVMLMELGKEIAALKAKEKKFTDSFMPFEPTRSIKPVGTRKLLIVTLGAVLGLMLGMFAAFLAEFIAKTRERINNEAG
jgi:uncharacterized protein involved in exopolysaccharide biosynthesis